MTSDLAFLHLIRSARPAERPGNVRDTSDTSSWTSQSSTMDSWSMLKRSLSAFATTAPNSKFSRTINRGKSLEGSFTSHSPLKDWMSLLNCWLLSTSAHFKSKKRMEKKMCAIRDAVVLFPQGSLFATIESSLKRRARQAKMVLKRKRPSIQPNVFAIFSKRSVQLTANS